MKIKSVFEQSRQELLDMGLRGNTLLSLGKGAKVLDIVDEKSSQVFDTLVRKNKAMKFLPIPDDLEDEESSMLLSDLEDHLQGKVGTKRHEDTALQTQLVRKNLDTRLLKIHSEALTYVQEQGVDILYIATGFLKWYEDQNSDKVRYAPLVLIPVELTRAEAGDAFKLSYTDADLGTNLTLAAKLKMDFAIELPQFESDEEDLQLDDYFGKVSQAVVKEKRWEVVSDKIALSFFSFGKFQMYQDLSDDAWPEGKKPSDSDVIRKLFGGGFESDSTSLESTPMDVNKAEAIQLVLDSDSSQTEAVLAAKSGSNLVIQGPPGTGKSQTITNIISQALADDKKILFVAEKMAALDVVKRRLDNCHIGDSVLELHSHKANKKTVLGSLEETLLQKAPMTPQRSDDIQKLVSLRSKLDNYTKAVNTPVKKTGLSYQVALGHSLQTEQSLDEHDVDKALLPAITAPISNWQQRDYREVVGTIQELVDYLSAHDAPFKNSFSSTKLREASPSLLASAQSIATQLAEVQHRVVDKTKQLSESASLLASVDSYSNALDAIDSLEVIASKPNLQGVNTEQSTWNQNGSKILQFARDGLDLQAEKYKLESEFVEQAFDFDWSTARGIFSTTGRKWWRFLSGDFRRMKASYAGLRKDGLTGGVDEWLSSIDALQELKSSQKKFVDSAQAAIQVIGDNYRNDNTDWSSLLEPLQWVYQTTKSINDKEIDANVAIHFDRPDHVVTQTDLKEINDLIAQRDSLLDQLCGSLELDWESFSRQISNGTKEQTDGVIKQTDNLYELVRFNRIARRLNDQNLNPWSTMAHSWEFKPDLLLTAFQYKFHSQLVNEVYEKEQAIKEFDRVEHEQSIEKFKEIDKQLFNFAQEKLVEDLFSRLPNPSARGEVETLRREFNKKRRHLPIRRLLNRSGRAIQQIKPVFMMSPMSIATYLEPGSIEFDLVIFDEASQVKVADGLGAILRGKQVIVVGDTKQMPPTSFFGRQFSLDDEEAEDSLTADIESILGMFLASGAPEKMLRWHYRSRHESLIAVSNQEFYDNNLMIFPSSGINPYAKGLSFNHLPETTYDRGGARVNVGEATEVANAVMKHARELPHQTLGVVAFSTAQRDAILLEVERLRKENPDLEHFFGEHPEGEDFFVKNLENVQGDERDTIYISIGYGKTSEGRLPMSFGPVNTSGGERRLNVLISRSRLSMQVFCNFKADEMPTTAESPFGVRAMKNFLHYAKTKELVRPEETGKEPDSPFEEEVISTIRGLGYTVQPQVGCAGFYIDIAVRDPSKLGRYMLAVECDGATYHSSKSARDRDRIRQGVLEGLGWRFHRIWSTDWFRNRHKESQRLDDALKSAKAFYANYDESKVKPKPASKPAPKAKIERVEVEESSSAAIYTMANTKALNLKPGLTIPDLDTHRLASDIEKVLNMESPMHSKHLAIRLLSAIGTTRSGARITRSINEAIRYLQRSGKVTVDGDYLIFKGKETVVRNRRDLPSNERKFDFVYEGEIAIAATETVNDTFSIAKDDLIKSVTEVLGFSSTSQAMRNKVEAVLHQQEKLGAIQLQGDTYRVG
ncbi:DUF3320 domain-containing protein [Vibrio breoganii]|uniref:DUF3320 domain-containing protein n=1 Tax=Vibrio breoganii TaxID=553239 RepID=UPI001F5341A6|nr:DUF3320 domain-containing protein [Vibrio breoganii]